MNKDESICLQARQNLYLSDEQIDELIRAKEQLYFEPYNSGCSTFNRDSSILNEHFSCRVCKLVPLNLQECTSCKSCIVCIKCQLHLKKKAAE